MKTARDFTILNPNDADLARFEAALYYLQQGIIGNAIIEKAQTENVRIVFADANNLHSGYSATERIIVWNPTEGVAVEDINGNDVGVQSPANGLMHEFAHSIDPKQLDQRLLPNAQYLNESEAMATMYADAVAKETGEVTRNNYKGHDIALANITAHTSGGAGGGQEWAQVGANGTVEHGPAYVQGTTTAPQFGTVDAYKNIWDFSGGSAQPDPGPVAPVPPTGGVGAFQEDAPLPIGGDNSPDPAPAPAPPSETTPPEGPIGWVPIGGNADGPIYGGGSEGGGGAINPLMPIDDEGDSVAPSEQALNGKMLAAALGGHATLSFSASSPSAPDGNALAFASAGIRYTDYIPPSDKIAIGLLFLIDDGALAHVAMIGVAAPHDLYVM